MTVSISLAKLIKILMVVVIVIVCLSGYLLSYYFYGQYREVLENPQAATQKADNIIMKEIGALIELPQNETPQIATVIDKTKLPKEPFFTKAENNDIIISYQSGELILYRPSTHKIVVMTLADNNQTQSQLKPK